MWLLFSATHPASAQSCFPEFTFTILLGSGEPPALEPGPWPSLLGSLCYPHKPMPGLDLPATDDAWTGSLSQPLLL